jgi:competence protein ComEA
VDINRADVLALQALPGIGPGLAARIVAYRKAHGRFDEPTELLEVEGIGSKRFERLRPWVLTR